GTGDMRRPDGPVKSASRTAVIVRCFAAVVTLAATTIGLPLMLYKLGGSPIPTRLPSFRVMIFVLLHKDNGSLFLGAVRDISWLAWAAFALAVLAEAQAALRGRPAPRLHLVGLQGAAARLVAVVSVGFSSPVAVTLAATPIAAPAALEAQVQRAVTPDQAQSVTLNALATPAVVTMRDAAHLLASHDTVLVGPGDCLWTIAQQYLGSGERYPALVRLNLGRDMGDGQVFTNPSLIMPGWHLRLPEGTQSVDNSPQPQQHPGHPSGSKHFSEPHNGAASGSDPRIGPGTGAGTGRVAGGGSEPQASGSVAS